MGASAIELRGKFGVMDDRDRDPRTTMTLSRLPKVDSRSLSLNLSFPSFPFPNKAHICICTGLRVMLLAYYCRCVVQRSHQRMNQPRHVLFFYAVIIIVSIHLRKTEGIRTWERSGDQSPLGPTGCCCSLMATGE